MNLAKIVFAPQVDAAILNLIDYVDPDELQGVLQFLDKIQKQLVSTLSMFPES